MSKIVYFIIVCVVVVTAVTVVSITGVDAYGETKFVQVSVLAREGANYGVDERPLTIPAVSAAIIEDKVHDLKSDLVTEIPYTVLPPKTAKPAGATNDHTQPEGQAEVHNGYGNDGSSVSNQNGNNGNNGNSTNNGTDHKDKNKNKDKSNDKGNDKDKGNGGGSDNGKASEKSNGDDNGNGNKK